MKVITLATAKTYLGITDTAQDAVLTANIPIIDAKTKQICHNQFNLQILVKTVSGSDIVELFGWSDRRVINTWPTPELEQLAMDLPVGTLLEGDGIPANTYIDEVYYDGDSQTGLGIPSFKMSNNATESNDSVYIYAGINIAYQQTIAKGLYWLTQQANTTIVDNTWKSRSVGPESVTKEDGGDKLDSKSGMPLWYVKAMPRYHR